MAQLDQQIIDVLIEDHPQSVRHVFYRMTDPRLPEPVEKSERGYNQVQHRIKELRRAGRVPYGWISDSTRRGYYVPTYRDSSDFLRAVAGMYRADLWQHADCYVEVWTESRSIAAVVQDDCEELAVSLYPSGGFASMTLVYEAAKHMLAAAGTKPMRVFYIGDYDPAGVLIDRNIESELRLHLGDGVDLRFERLGITEEQIEHYDLPSKPRKSGDRRARYIERTVEAEAMPARILRQLLRDRIEALLPPQALHAARVAEESERAGLLALARVLKDPA